ncbi:rCG26152 [Rattus norvegicus]|uniref:RCG26152 n=1 Tax=Rattus norvegicus TaxID=10116 RepID=A6HNY3_RAT|nr:rCG26152 [Rattus norvegicus]
MFVTPTSQTNYFNSDLESCSVFQGLVGIIDYETMNK